MVPYFSDRLYTGPFISCAKILYLLSFYLDSKKGGDLSEKSADKQVTLDGSSRNELRNDRLRRHLARRELSHAIIKKCPTSRRALFIYAKLGLNIS
jgi:hypothetical protein